MDGTILVADDDRTIRTVLTQALTRAGCRVHATSSLTMLMTWVAEGRGDAVITDVMMPDGNGLDMLPKIHADRPNLPVIVISAQNTIMTAIKANEAAAFDYLPKPFDLPDLMSRVSRALSSRPKRSGAQDVQAEDGNELPLVGRSAVMQALYKSIARVMNTNLPVTITGASGTGKTLVARILHDYSDRRAAPFVTVSGPELAESDNVERVLSRVKQGSLLIEEVSQLPDAAQVALVRLLDQQGADGARVICTSQEDPIQAIENGTLREDLYYRVSAATLALPALCDRVEDISPLASHFLSRNEGQPGQNRHISAEAVALLSAYGWPGNVRQLENTIRRLGLDARNPEIGREEVVQALGSQPEIQPVLAGYNREKLSDSVGRHVQRYFDLHGNMLPPAGLYARILREVEVPLLEIALNATGGNQAKCADLLGINRNTLRKKLTELDIEVTRRRKLM